jgi:glycosyltransferase involved in cell wall biosynthesis
MISFIVPAHNEQAYLPATLAAINEVRSRISQPSEVIVVNDASTDNTAEVAEALGATVINVQHQHIAATRNAGGRLASGQYLFFVDADTQISLPALEAAMAALRKGCAGGGFLVDLDGYRPWWAQALLPLATAVCQRMKICGGACLFCTKSAFVQLGGFDEVYFAAEDLAFVRDIKRIGKFCLPQERVMTSARKFDAMTFSELLPLTFRLIWFGPESFRSKRGLDLWYSNAVRLK